MPIGMVGFDGGDGRVRWRSGLWRGSFLPRGYGIATDPSLPGFAFVRTAERGRIGALDVATGSVAWVHPPRGEAPCPCGDFAADGGRVAVSCNQGRVAILDGRTGAARSIRVDGWVSSGWASCPLIDLAGDTLTTTNGFRLDVYDVTSGARRWTQPLPDGDVSAGRDGVLVTTAGGAVRSLDSATGQELWRWWVPVGVRDDAAPVVLFGRGTATGRDVVLTFTAGAVARLGPPPGSAPTEATITTITGRAQLDGAVRAGRRVRVGDEIVTTDARGHFRATVRGRGILRVTVEEGPLRRRHRCLVTPPTTVPLDARRGRIRIDIRARSGPEMCGGCDCD
ncbi:MAG: PQQ-binding-like beta-propeller repeat protein [Deltaproteobacteria bacterium]|nr:PQQ-binding-like beta-propeller repeat protein [Deltaproteobacteria bacterium]